ncbi:hypothetical protein KP509_09G101200 [Ceratopteris richardii]|uniref:Partial AB-hydrolase lipase domain-containing protein n=1 Tax=Ceratopteris richardii TaxID=49495 RepID=A0A8T2U3X9_CERRI|nr:hypothetical protein KP509_09G101200 [Ceratopteris richardii]
MKCTTLRPTTVITEDGFVLGVQRISSSAAQGDKRQPVFLMHGILSGGDTWLLNSPDQSLGFILADAGYDVWIGNFRTTNFCHGHILYTSKDKEYWDWSFQELAEKDLISMVEYAYKTTNMRLHYIGYSQGTQAALAALSQGMLAERIDKVVMMAPVAYLKHTATPIGILAARLQLDRVFNGLRVFSLNTKTTAGRQYVDILCPAWNDRCFNIWVNSFTGVNCCINASRRAFYDAFETQDTSTKNLRHLAQLYRRGTFAKFDYGADENMRRYGVSFAPDYDLSKVPTGKMLIIHGEKDVLADVDDVSMLKEQLPQGYRSIFIQEYAHIDFIIGYNANTKVYRDILHFLSE